MPTPDEAARPRPKGEKKTSPLLDKAEDLSFSPQELVAVNSEVNEGSESRSEQQRRSSSASAPASGAPRGPSSSAAGERQNPRPVPKRKLYQDEIYGSKELSPLAAALIDTPEFQRLGHVYQLGMTYAVFRGANHRRFDHCVGAYFMSRTLMRRIVQNHARMHASDEVAFAHPGAWISKRLYVEAPGTLAEDQLPYSPMGRWRGLVELVSAATLLHDLGHIPVGHTLEDEFSVFEKHDGLGGSRLFELLYGPRRDAPQSDAIHPIEKYFGPIDEDALPAPVRDELRVPLPWVFEEGVYAPFFREGKQVVAAPESSAIPGLANWELRDLVYLILSFKEEISDRDYISFDQMIGLKKDNAKTRSAAQRLDFIKHLHEKYRKPCELGQEHASVPLFQPFMADIVSNTICADLLDYLVRDGRRLGLEMRNNARLQRYLVIRPESSFVRPKEESDNGNAAPANLRLTINAVYRNGLPRRDTVSDLLDLMRERHRFAEVVYYHPKKCAFSAMLAKALELCADRPRDGEGLYPAPWCPVPTKTVEKQPHVTHFGDESLLAWLGNTNRNEVTNSLARRIVYRDEYRLLFTIDYEAANEAGVGPLKFIRDLRDRDKTDEGRREWEMEFAKLTKGSSLAGLLGGEPPVLIYCPNLQMQAKEVAARVEISPGRVIPLNRQWDARDLQQEMITLNEKYKSLWRLHLFVHPRLIMGAEAGSEKAAYLHGVVDAFCDRYGVKPAARVRGSRLKYESLDERTKGQFDLWSRELPDGFPRERILESALDLNLWRVRLDRALSSIPVNSREFADGFSYAAGVVAAGDASTGQRSGWLREFREYDSSDWIRAAAVPRVDALRRQATARMIAGTGSFFAAEGRMRNRPKTWEEFVESIAGIVGQVPREK